MSSKMKLLNDIEASKNRNWGDSKAKPTDLTRRADVVRFGQFQLKCSYFTWKDCLVDLGFGMYGKCKTAFCSLRNDKCLYSKCTLYDRLEKV